MEELNKLLKKCKENWRSVAVALVAVVIFCKGVLITFIGIKNFIMADYLRAGIILLGVLSAILVFVGFSNGTYSLNDIFPEKKKPSKNKTNEEMQTANYRFLRKVLYSISHTEIAKAAHIMPVTNVTSLNASPKATAMNGYVIYHYNMVLDGGRIDVKTIQALLQKGILRFLEDDLAGVSKKQSIFFNGNWIPAIVVDSVIDMGNGMVRANLTIPTMEYLQQKEYRLQTSAEIEETVVIDEDDF